MQKLDIDQTTINALEDMKRLARLRASAKPAPQFLDFSNLEPSNLEANNFIDLRAGYLKPKEIAHCGRCEAGWNYRWLPNRIAQEAQMCHRCEKPRRWLKQLDKMKLPSDAINMHFETYQPDSPQQKEAIDAMLTYLRAGCEGSPHGLYLYGQPGNGKTSLLYCFARESAYLGLKVRYTSHIELMNKIKESWNNKSARDPLKDWLAGIDLLLLDEFCGVGGSANKSPWWLSQTVELIQDIYRQWESGQLSIVMTSNVYPRQLLNIFADNPAVRSRLAAMFSRPIEMIGKDRRLERVDMSAWGC